MLYAVKSNSLVVGNVCYGIFFWYKIEVQDLELNQLFILKLQKLPVCLVE